MQIYLMRHGIAHQLSKDSLLTDAERTLTKTGKAKIYAAAKGMQKLDLKFGHILSSPLSRALETASIVAEVLQLSNHLSICGSLALGIGTKKLMSDLSQYKHYKSLLLVGHEPNLSYFATCLVSQKSSNCITFKKGSLCRIDIPNLSFAVHGLLRWFLTSNQLRLIGSKQVLSEKCQKK